VNTLPAPTARPTRNPVRAAWSRPSLTRLDAGQARNGITPGVIDGQFSQS
jgi:hypothetical protein